VKSAGFAFAAAADGVELAAIDSLLPSSAAYK
jgi:hypothetical protein